METTTPVGRGRGATTPARKLLPPVGSPGGAQAKPNDAMTEFFETFTNMMRTRMEPDSSTPASGSGASVNVKIQAPKNFQLNQNFRIWLERFDNFVKLAKIPVTQRREQLLSRLEHQAYVAVNNLHLEESLSYNEFCSQLMKRFHNVSREDYKLQMRARVQRANETYEAFSDALQELALNAFPSSGFELQQEMALDQFLLGVTAEDAVKQQLLMSSPTTLSEAIRKVRQLEAAQLVMKKGEASKLEATKSTQKVASVAPKPENSEMAKVLELLTSMNDRILQLEGQKGSQRQGDRSGCKTCGSDHRFRVCPQNECYKCHSKGHISKDCPRQQGNENAGLPGGNTVPQKQ